MKTQYSPHEKAILGQAMAIILQTHQTLITLANVLKPRLSKEEYEAIIQTCRIINTFYKVEEVVSEVRNYIGRLLEKKGEYEQPDAISLLNEWCIGAKKGHNGEENN